MSIAAISSQFANTVRRAAASAPAESIDPSRASPRIAGREHQGAGHELVAALNQALGLQGEQEKTGEPAVFRFAHELMQDLRTLSGEDSEASRGRGWGNLSQRLGALATAAAQGAAPSDVPEQPKPITPTTAAVHIMKVPSSHLLEAFVTLQRALGQQAESAAPADPRARLAAVVRKLAATVAPSSGAAPGAVLNTSA